MSYRDNSTYSKRVLLARTVPDLIPIKHNSLLAPQNNRLHAPKPVWLDIASTIAAAGNLLPM